MAGPGVICGFDAGALAQNRLLPQTGVNYKNYCPLGMANWWRYRFYRRHVAPCDKPFARYNAPECFGSCLLSRSRLYIRRFAYGPLITLAFNATDNAP